VVMSVATKSLQQLIGWKEGVKVSHVRQSSLQSKIKLVIFMPKVINQCLFYLLE
jgi:hypothetical protein